MSGVVAYRITAPIIIPYFRESMMKIFDASFSARIQKFDTIMAKRASFFQILGVSCVD